MNLVLALLFAVVSVANAPTACAHALKTDSGAHHGAHDAAQADMMHDGAHMANQSHTEDMPAQHSAPHQPCADDCDGGYGCEGCAIGAAAVLTQSGQTVHAAPDTALTALADIHDGAIYAAEPPPPRLR